MLENVVLGYHYVVETDSGHQLTLSGDHYVRVFDKNNNNAEIYIAAEELVIGQILMIVTGMAGYHNYSMIYSPIVSINQKEVTGVYTVFTYSGSLIVSRIVASCYISQFGSHQRNHIRCFAFRLWKRLATMFNFTPYTDEFVGIHPVFSYRLLNVARICAAIIYEYALLVLKDDTPIILFTLFIIISTKIILYFTNKSRGRSATLFSRCT